MKKEISALIQFGPNTNVLSTTQYAGGMIYENGTLEMIPLRWRRVVHGDQTRVKSVEEVHAAM